MGFLDKVKNLFTEEVDEPIVKKEEPKKHEQRREIQTQERTVEIAPARRETTALLEEEVGVEEVIPQKKEEKPLSIYFSDEDFADLEKPKAVEEKKEVKEFKDLYSGRKEETKKEDKKSFKPSPIISPVYGILDKNYKKDDITTKENTTQTYKSDKVTVDDIRNKAYGVLEDELESNLLGSPIIVENKEEDTNLDIFEELETRESRSSKKDLLREDLTVEKTDLSAELEKQKQQIEEINEIIKNTISPDKEKVTSRKIDNILEELDEIEELIPAKEENNIEEDFEEEKSEIVTEEEQSVEESYEDDYEEEYDDDYEDDYEEEYDDDSLEEEIEENMNTSEENEDNKDELEESDLFNLIDSMYEKRDE